MNTGSTDFQAKGMVLWSDEAVVAVNKPAGLPTLPDGYQPGAPYVLSVLEPEFGKLYVVHRLDRQTSGILILARSAEAHRFLNTQFETRQTVKTYHALAVGSPAWEETRIDRPLRANVGHRHRTVVDERQGKPAATRLRVLERLGGYTLLEAVPETGRTHQVRAHLAYAGFPIAGDELYGGGAGIFDPEGRPVLERTGLHARSLAVRHPITRDLHTFEAPYPPDFEQTLSFLRAARRRGLS